jgi:uncharacterized surface protein with fasciclin (FAS1) repeats
VRRNDTRDRATDEVDGPQEPPAYRFVDDTAAPERADPQREPRVDVAVGRGTGELPRLGGGPPFDHTRLLRAPRNVVSQSPEMVADAPESGCLRSPYIDPSMRLTASMQRRSAKPVVACLNPSNNPGDFMNVSRIAGYVLAGVMSSVTLVASAQVMVGGAAMYPTKDIIDNAVNSKDHTTLVAAVKAAGLVDTLKGKGPFTVFAPTNEAFAALPAGTVDTLLKPENKAMLTKILTYHVVAGDVDSAALLKAIAAGGGKATLKTVEGGTLTAMKSGNGISLTDAKGGVAMVTIADVKQSNGVIHVIDKVLLPG